MRIQRLLVACLSSLPLLLVLEAHAAISISPLKYELNINPGQESSQTVRVMNQGNEPVTLYTSREDFVAGDETGTPKFVKIEEQTSDVYSMAKWISVDNENITLAKGESRDVRFTIKVPTNAEPGGHYGAIFFSPGAKNNAQVAIVQRIGALVLVNVPGDVKISGSVADFKTGEKDKNGKFAAKDFFSSFPIEFQIAFNNEGSTHLKPTGKIELLDENNEILKGIGKESLTSPQGAYIGERLVDYLPINPTEGNTLPKTKRIYNIDWEGFGFSSLDEKTGQKEVKFKSLTDYYATKAKQTYLNFWESIHTHTVKKPITANLTLSYEGKDRVKQDFHKSQKIMVTYEEQYVGLNYIVVGLIVLLIGGGFYYIRVYLPKSRAKLKEELLRELNKS